MKPILEQAPPHVTKEEMERNAARFQMETEAYEEDAKREREPVDLAGRLASLIVGQRIRRIRTYSREKTPYVHIIFSNGDSLLIGSTPDVEMDNALTFHFTKRHTTTHDLSAKELKL